MTGRASSLARGRSRHFAGAALLTIFMFQNTESVTLHFLVWRFSWPLWLLVLLSAIFGALVWIGLGVMRRHRRRKERRADRRDDVCRIESRLAPPIPGTAT